MFWSMKDLDLETCLKLRGFALITAVVVILFRGCLMGNKGFDLTVGLH